MTHEIEKYLLKKLKEGLEPKEGKSPKIAFPGRLRKLETLTDGKLKSSTRDDKLIRDNLYSLNNVLTECQTISKKQIYANIRVRNSLKRIEDDLEKSSSQNTGGSNKNPQGNTEESSSDGKNSLLQVSGQLQDPQNLKGFEKEIVLLESLVQKESAEQFRAIAVVGRDGIGKTTLCRQFFKQEAEKETQKLNKEESMQKLKKEETMNKPNEEEGTQKQNKEDLTQKMPPSSKDLKYCPRIWVSMSRRPDEDKDQKVAIIKRMLKLLGVEEETIESAFSAPDVSGLVSMLHQQLWGKKYLIVLDNVRGNEEWYYDLCSCLVPGSNWGDRLAYGFPKGYGGTVIVTSRNEELTMRMVGEENLHMMMPLSDDKVRWLILQDSAQKGLNQVDPQNVNIPLAAKVMGQIVNKQRQEESAKIANSQ